MSGRTKNPKHKWKVSGEEHGTLCLSRQVGESLLIGEEIEILIVRIRGQVTMSVRAPKNLTIRRSELCE